MMVRLCPRLASWCELFWGRSPRSGIGIQAIDVRELLLSGNREKIRKALRYLRQYMPAYQKAFPIPGEIEEAVVYVLYMICKDLVEALATDDLGQQHSALKHATALLEEYFKAFAPAQWSQPGQNSECLWGLIYLFATMDPTLVATEDGKTWEECFSRTFCFSLMRFGMSQDVSQELVVFVLGLRSMLGKCPMDWKMIVFVDSEDRIVGGFHYQVLLVRGRKYAWGEHFWGVESPNRPEYFSRALSEIKRELEARGVSRVFLEFNDPWKMTEEEIQVDTLAGLPPTDRLWMWALLKAKELVVPVTPAEGSVNYRAAKSRTMRATPLSGSAPYAQPAMGEDDPPVTLLTLGFISLDGEMETMDRGEYWELIRGAHSTIPGVDPCTDETCMSISAALEQGPDVYEFRSLFQRFEPRL